MNLSKFIKRSVFLLFPVSLITGCLGVFDETYSSTYQNYEQAFAHGAIQRGWIPHFLPASATNIFEKHDLDTNETIAKFNFDITKSTDLVQSCQMVNKFSTPKSLTAKWWSNDVVKSADAHFYCDQHNFYMVVNGNTVYYWQPSILNN